MSFIKKLSILLLLFLSIYLSNCSKDRHEFDSEIESFLKERFPAIIEKRKSIIKNLENVEEKIDKLNALSDKYPQQNAEIKPYLSRWENVAVRLDKSLIEIQSKTVQIFVRNELTGINNSGHLEESISAYDKELGEEINKILLEIDTINKAYETGKDLDLSAVEPVKQKIEKVKTESSSNGSRFTIRSSTFIDNKTGYMWEKKPQYNWLGNYGKSNDDYEKREPRRTWNEAKNYCANLNLEGYSDWKLPSRDELHTLMTAYYGEQDSWDKWQTWFDNNKHKITNNHLFVPKEISNIIVPFSWSSTISETDSSDSWIVGFNHGDDNWNSQTDDNFVVCVRDL